jgi:DNA-directed RNA polymerase subunit beta'
MLDMSARQLERVIYYEDYIVIDPGKTPLQKTQLLNEVEYREAQEQYGEDFVAGMGAEAIKKLLSEIDLNKLNKELEKAMGATKSKQIRKKLAKRLKLVQGFQSSRARPEWMILEVLPVIPPDLRPLVPLEGGRFATSDLNDLYRRVINRNNRLKNLLMLKTPDVIIRNEKRMLQEAVDALFDNGRHGRAVTGAGNRPLKSLSDMLKGKGGRFRQNLLGKRVDYSGRSVIVIGPELKLNQCGLPKKMALVLFEPFIIRRLKDLGYVHTVRSAKKMIERQTPEVWDILDEVTRGHPVLLNRAPTLHRLSIQAFEPQLIEGEAIRIHPLVCTAYNADFDGDQMAVHVPLSVEAQLEARMLMLAPNNIFSPSSGKPITTPSQDITLGCYYITQNPRAPKKDGRHLPLFADAYEVEFAMVEGTIKTHDRILFKNPDRGRQTIFGNSDVSVIETTAGRVIFNQIWPKELGFFNKPAGKKQLSDIIWRCYQIAGPAVTVATLDKLKELGFREATRAGISIGIEDMIIPKRKESELENAYKQVKQVDQQYRRGIITDGERYNKIIDIWTHAGDQISNVMFREIEENQDRKEYNPINLMVDSGARGNRQQVRQLAGMRGLMAKPSGEIIERPITSNFREGLTVLEYFISTHGARKGLADTALKTADSGYLTRKLVDAAQDVIIVKDDCGTVNGIVVRSIYEGDEEVVDLGQRIIGRVSCETIGDPVEKKKKIVKANQYVDEKIAADLQRIGVEQLKIRSVLTCECGRGVCAMCYGRNLATGDFVKLGEAVGIIAAQSIGEPGTQLTMRTFHIGGTASQTFKQPIIKAKNDGTVQFNDLRTVQALDGSWIVLNKNGSISVHNEEGRELERYNVVVGSVISKEDGASVKKGETFVQWDPYNVPILTDKGGKIEFRDMIAGVTIKREVDEATGLMGTMVIEHKEDLHPQVVIVDDKKEVLASYSIPAGAHVIVEEGQKIRAGALLAKTPRKVAKTKDITGGLPRVAELFEARRPKDAAEIAKIDGIVELGGTVRGKRSLILKDPDTGAEEEHLIPLTKHIIVFKGDYVKKGQQLTEGPIVPHEILEVCGPQELQEHLVNEVQEVYRLQGVEINDKHIEIIVRQMLRKVKITDPGDTSLLWGDQVDKLDFEEENKKVVEKGGKPAEAVPVLLGITKASLETDSFISAASFQDTTRVLTEAATLGKIDRLRGFKENVIMGHLIPAGTGFPEHRQLKLVEKGEPVGAPVMEEAEPQPAIG